MKLIIDKGNTRTKIAVFKEAEMLYLNAVTALNISLIYDIISNYKITHTIYCSVLKEEQTEILNYLSSQTQLLIMSEDLELPIRINYLPKYSLGNDRIAAMVGVSLLYQKKSAIVIDAGSCICVDYINSNSEYKGGSISLGFQMKSKALNTFTAALPLVEIDNNIPPICSNNTYNCIKSGIINGTLLELKGMISYYTELEKAEIEIILTGGDAKLISSILGTKNIVEEHLVLKGLNIILEYNTKRHV